MNDYLLAGLAGFVVVALVAMIVQAARSSRTQRVQQQTIEELSRQIAATNDALGEVKSGVAALATHAAGESAAEQQRFDTLVQQVRETGRATEEQRREIAQQLEQQRQTVDARLGTMSTANFIFLLMIFLLLVKSFSMSLRISQLETRLKDLVQRIALDNNDREEEKEEKDS